SEVRNTYGFYFNTKTQKSERHFINTIINSMDNGLTNQKTAEQQLALLLETYFIGQQQPLLLNGEIAAQVFKKNRGKRVEMTQEHFEQCWQGSESSRGFAEDDYLQYFWRQCPDISEHIAAIENLYQEQYSLIEKEVIKNET
nr:hypothetical protein [Colwellia sp.]